VERGQIDGRALVVTSRDAAPLLPPTTVVQAWISAANAANIGTPAVMGPIRIVAGKYGPVGVSDYGDCYWGRGPVGPTIPASQINGWWYIQG
jgi:hypothetical protein